MGKGILQMLEPGIKGHAALRVTTENTAQALGTGTVGTSLSLAHTAPTPIGMVVHCDCELTAVADRRLTFTARVYDDVSEVAHATHERYIVDNDRFIQKASAKLSAE